MMYIRYIFITILTLPDIVLATNNGSFFEMINAQAPSNYIYNLIKSDADMVLKDHIISFDEFKVSQEESIANWDNAVLDESKKPKEKFEFFNIYFKKIDGINREKYTLDNLFINAFDVNRAIQAKNHNGIVDDLRYIDFLTINLTLGRYRRNKYFNNVSESTNLLKKTFISFSPKFILFCNKCVKYCLLILSFIFDFDLQGTVQKYSITEKYIQENQFIDTEYLHKYISLPASE